MNDFDWNDENSWSIIATCLEIESGGTLHVFRPCDLFYLDKEEALKRLKTAFCSMSPEEQSQYL